RRCAGKGKGAFSRAGRVGADGYVQVVAADLNHDAIPDLVSPRGVLAGDGKATFAAAVPFPPPPVAPPWGLGSIVSVAAADFNRDGRLDVAFVRLGSDRAAYNDVFVRFGNGDGTVQPETLANGMAGGSHTDIALGAPRAVTLA